MDLGATLCTRNGPGCLLCPVSTGCRGLATGEPVRFPAPRPRRPYPTREKLLVVMRDAQGRALVERRPPSGIWGGLWSFPEFSTDLDVEDSAAEAARRHGLRLWPPGHLVRLPPVEHGFTHFRLRAIPVVVSVAPLRGRVAEGEAARWIEPGALSRGSGGGGGAGGGGAVGLAAPVSAILSRLEKEERGSP